MPRQWILVASAGLLLWLAPAPAAACDPTRVAECEAECDRGEAAACHDAAESYDKGRGVAASPERAEALYRRGCDGKFPWSCYRLGQIDPRRYGALHRKTLAADNRACKRGAADGCLRLGLLYREGRGVRRDLRRAQRMFRTACDGGEVTACGHLAVILLETRGARASEAGDLLVKACDGKVPWACLELGKRQLSGDGLPEDKIAGARLLDQACSEDQMLACVVLGDEFIARQERDAARRAVDLYRRACSGGTPAGCLRLGGLYEQGVGVKRDVRRAVELFEQACGANVGGCFRLGRLLEAGDGVPRDETRARELYVKSCGAADDEGCLHLAISLAEGRGGEADPARARELLVKLCTHKSHALACQILGDQLHKAGGRQAARARSYYARSCKLGREQACELARPAKATRR